MSEIYETIKCCRICSEAQLQEILNLGDQPPANSLYSVDENSPSVVPLRLMYCKNCSAVQLGENVDPEYLFSQYLWVTGTSVTAEQYSHEFSKEALNKLEDCGKHPYVIEIASNDGTFLASFLNNGCKVLGIDPAKNIGELATQNGIPTRIDFFSIDLAKTLVEEAGKPDIVFARNVIPHAKEIHSVINGISTLLKEESLGIIEFHNAGLILDELHYDYIYHEHLFYFTLKTISKLIGRYGLYIYDIMHSPISGGSWVIYFSRKEKVKSERLIDAEKQEIEKEINTYQRWLDFSNQARLHSEKLNKIVCQNKEKIPAYGASARSATLLNFCGINSEHISVVIDKNPLKHGLITSGSNIPIISFEEGLKVIKGVEKLLLLAWNFQDEIIQELRAAGFSGQFIIPLPGEPHIA